VSVAASGAQANSDSDQAVISGDGRYVLFEDYATKLSSRVGGAAYVRIYR
jgi:hypothetical protein